MNDLDRFAPRLGAEENQPAEAARGANWSPPSLLDAAREVPRRPLQEVSTRTRHGDELD
jgi:hypothetical protein